MLNHSDLEYLKKVNGIRKKLGFSIDLNQLKQNSFLKSLEVSAEQIPINKPLIDSQFSLQ